MENILTDFDLVFARRTRLEDSETFDFIIDDENYYRFVITNYFNTDKVSICTNIKEFAQEPIFSELTDNDDINIILIQAKFCFENFIAMEKSVFENNEELNLQINIVEVDELISDYMSAKNSINSFVENNQQVIEAYSQNQYVKNKAVAITDFENLLEEMDSINVELDNVFISEDIIE
ncbi:hypothetical protein LJB88_00400 [Erysipelotrichaceae bacterium OttesenSCG-928-M19]|nr:hypothetical protein [Erysipelotrichaceae bacterium OttesenSCG-928-M19]